jgi:hypothetical protein
VYDAAFPLRQKEKEYKGRRKAVGKEQSMAHCSVDSARVGKKTDEDIFHFFILI